MSKVWAITRREFLVTVTKKSYLATIFLFPVLIAGIGGLSSLAAFMAQKKAKEGKVGLVDKASLLPKGNSSWESSSGKEFFSRPSLDAGLEAIKQKELKALYVIEPGYMETGEVTLYRLDEGGIFNDFETPAKKELLELLRDSLVRERLDPELSKLVMNPAKIKEERIQVAGQTEKPRDLLKRGADLGYSIFFVFILMMAVFTSAGFLLRGVAEEKENRVVEILASSVTAQELMTGKILGLGGAGLLQVLVYMVLAKIAVPLLPYFFQIASLPPIDWFAAAAIVYFILGYLFYAGLMAAVGVLGETAQQSQQLSGFFMMPAAIPLWFLQVLLAEPQGTLARVLSYIPFTAPTAMMLRLPQPGLPWIDVVGSMLMLALSAYFMMRLTAKIFRAGLLLYGKRPSPREIFRWLRDA